MSWQTLSLVYARKGEWGRAIEFYEQSLQAKEQVGDIHGMASTWTNMALLHLRSDRAEEAQPLLAQACLVFALMGSPHADTAERSLVEACGSLEAVNDYLAQMAVGEGE